MRLFTTYVTAFCIIICSFCLNAASQSSPWYSFDDVNQVRIKVELFVSSTCPHCHKAAQFFAEMEETYPWLEVETYVINKDKEALKLFNQRLKQQNSDNFSIPAFFFCGSHWLGYNSDETTGQLLMSSILYCREQIMVKGELTPTISNLLISRGDASKIQLQSSTVNTPFLFIPLTAFMDAASPCSLFSFAGLLAFLWVGARHRSQQLYLGMTYILSLGIAHYFFQSEFYFQLGLFIRLLALLSGGLILFYLYSQRRVLHTQKGLEFNYKFYFLIPLLVVVTFTYQQTCQMNMALVFAQWMQLQTFSVITAGLYQFIYHLLYVLPLTLFLITYLFISRLLRLVKYSELLRVAGCLILIVIAGLLIASPALLASTSLSALTLAFSLLSARFYLYLRKRHEPG